MKLPPDESQHLQMFFVIISMWLLDFAGWSLNPPVFLGAQLSLQPAWSTSAAHPVLLRWCENPCSYLDVKPHLSLVNARASALLPISYVSLQP